MRIKIIKLLLVMYFYILINLSESQENKCAKKETCGACIRNADCVWCNGPFVANSKLERCEHHKNTTSSWCADQDIVDPQSIGLITKNDSLQSSTTDQNEAVQITPQRVKLTLRPGQKYELNFSYARAKDYPVDLYYIMDLSASMKVHKDTLSKLGNKLSNTMKGLTKNFRLGFGSFVDKVEMPFTSTYKDLLKNPCFDSVCVPPYSFKNHVSLTEDEQKFTDEVKRAVVSGNLDFPEGGFDALMQAIVCQKDIGWRSKARRLLVLSTDADFHMAGDGKLAGIVLPNDGQCHMKNNEYTHGTTLDYPSIAQIRHTVIENNINVIFAIAKSNNTDRVLKVYQLLQKRIEGSAVGLLSTDSSNVVQFVTGVYNSIVEGVKISDTSSSDIEVKYYSTCGGTKEKETKECNELNIGVKVDFKAIIKVLNCPESNARKQTFEIRPGALDESIIVKVDMICDCDCEKHGIKHSSDCHNSGSLQCGICSCDAGKFGTNCECDATNTTRNDDDSNCRSSKTSPICSRLGTCKCNTCDCNERMNKDERIYGKYCECTNYSCRRINGALCSNNGKCDCGECICYAGYEGDACQCRDREACVAPNGKECNANGKCNCGTCKCNDSYYGQFCQECPTCEGQLCKELQDCVEYYVHKTGIYDSELKFNQSCSNYTNSNNTATINEIEDKSEENEKICRVIDNKDCTFYFKYYYHYGYNSESSLRILVQKEKTCPTEVNVLALVGGIIGSILLAGLLLLLLWKGATTIHDRREYAKFENERNNARWDRGENPLFKNPTTTFKNPTFNNENTL